MLFDVDRIFFILCFFLLLEYSDPKKGENNFIFHKIVCTNKEQRIYMVSWNEILRYEQKKMVKILKVGMSKSDC